MRWIWEIGGFISRMVGIQCDAVIKMGMDCPSDYSLKNYLDAEVGEEGSSGNDDENDGGGSVKLGSETGERIILPLCPQPGGRAQ